MSVVLSLQHPSSDGYIMAFLTGANQIGLIAAFVFSWMVFLDDFPPQSNYEEKLKW